jgi:hypothetical protein
MKNILLNSIIIYFISFIIFTLLIKYILNIEYPTYILISGCISGIIANIYQVKEFNNDR